MDKLKCAREVTRVTASLIDHSIRTLLFLCCLFPIGHSYSTAVSEGPPLLHMLCCHPSLKDTKGAWTQQGSHLHRPAPCARWLYSTSLPLSTVSSFPACQLKKTSGVSCHFQVTTHYNGTCNPEAFAMTCTSCRKINVWRIPQDDLTPARPLMW